MSPTDYKKAIQSELRQAGFSSKITKVAENENLRTTIKFDSKVNPELFRWLNGRFSNGVTAINENTVCLNHPNCDLVSN